MLMSYGFIQMILQKMRKTIDTENKQENWVLLYMYDSFISLGGKKRYRICFKIGRSIVYPEALLNSGYN